MKHLTVSTLIIAAVFLANCNNIDLLEKLEKPGNRTETFTSNNYIFVSSWMVQGDLAFSPFAECAGMTGTMKADCSCTRAAAVNGLRKNSSHQFIAVLSTGNPSIYDAVCKLQGLPQGACTPTDTAPWFNTKGEMITMGLSNLFNATNPVAIQYTENGAIPPTDLAWTGSFTSGINSSVNCANWSINTNAQAGTAGSRTGLNGQWLDNSSTPTCDTAQRVYCAGRI